MARSAALGPIRVAEAAVLPREGWLFLLAGFAAMYLPVYWQAATGIWQSDEQAHGALILLVVAWLFARRHGALAALRPRPAPAAGWPCFLFGLLLYFVGRAVGLSIFEFASQIPVLAGLFLIVQGLPGLRAAWFPLLYIVFMVPLPGVFVDAVTTTLKQWISLLAEDLLYALGYPIARSGVVLAIGPYQLLVADACSGLHSLYSLSALGVLFMYLTARKSLAHNLVMLAAILPAAFAANVVRVVFLVLVTYHFGDAAGQGFLHSAAGIVMPLVALLSLFLLDAVLARSWRQPLGAGHA